MEDLSPEETYKHKRNLYIGLSIIFIITGILLLTFAIKASASNSMLEIEVNPTHVSGTTYCIPQSAKTNPNNYHFNSYGPPYSGDYLQFQGFNSGTYTGTAPGSFTISNPNNNGSGEDAQTGFTCEGGYNVDVSGLGSGNVALILFQVGYQASRTNDWENNDVGYIYYATFYNYQPTYTPPNTNYNSRIEWVNPPKQTPSATTTSRTIDFEFNYFLNSASSTDVSKIILSLCPLSYPNDDCQQVDVGDITLDNYENISTTTTTNRDGYYLGIVSFWNGVEESTTCSWWDFWCEAEQVKIYGSVSNNFNVATTSLAVELPISYEAISSQCEDGNFAEEGICKALLWLFYPSGDVLTGMEELGTTIRGKVPFGYFYQVSDKLNAIATASSTEGSNIIVHAWGDDGVEITLMDWSSAKSFYEETFGNLDGYVVMLAWLAFAGYAFFRISEII